MALITCKECGGKVSYRATECPHCGYPLEYDESQEQKTEGIINGDYEENIVQPKSKKWLWVILIIAICAIGFGLYWLLSSDNSDKTATTETPTEEIVATDTTVNKTEVENTVVALPELKISGLCTWNDDEEVMTLRRGDRIDEYLSKTGFKKTSEKEEYVEADVVDAYYLINRVYKRENGKDSETINISINKDFDKAEMMTILFSSSANRIAFLSDAEQNKFTKISSTEYHGPNYENCYWTGADIEVKGNKVSIIERFEP